VAALTPDYTADRSIDQRTQLSPTFANRNATQLIKEDTDLEAAQTFVRNIPPSPDTQNCITHMQTIKDNIKHELEQRDKENVPRGFSPNQLQKLQVDQARQAAGQRYNINPLDIRDAGKVPPRRTSAGGGSLSVPLAIPIYGGDCGSGVDCYSGSRF